jgi:putative ABC transport system ATP-binding protein
LLDLLGQEDKAHLRRAELSGGEKQRVAVAPALIKNPTLFFADEPTASLDRSRGIQVVHLLCDAAHERNACLLMVSHEARLRGYADRVPYLEDGRLRKFEGCEPADESEVACGSQGGQRDEEWRSES